MCSCGVLPAAISLRRQGANKGATLSFLISTPVTGIDSILATYALLGWIFTLFRVATSFVIALVCGTTANFFLKQENKESVFQDSSCVVCGKKEVHSHGFVEKIKFVVKYSFDELLGDISKWLIIGILIGGIISYSVPERFIVTYLGQTWIAMFIMLLVGIPIYVCATGSIPIAAALMLKGMSPGAALVFLITGPATNTVSMTIIAKELGKKALGLYLFFISTISILAGILLNAVWGEQLIFAKIQSSDLIPEYIKTACAIILIGLIVSSLSKGFFKKISIHKKQGEALKQRLVVKVPEMDCAHCVQKIQNALNCLYGTRVEVDLKGKRVIVSSEKEINEREIIELISTAGYKAHVVENSK